MASDPTDAFVDAMTKEFAGYFRTALQQEFRKNAGLYRDGDKNALVSVVVEQVANIMQFVLPKELPGK
ncbi:hypothetical protein [Bradyrhizobium lablabi]|uniref:hypothetical protein n=1 Tax=Bradyrhizobium lablabi TaxID=722472 RepID=UPI0009A6566E|nr:hypothetical protein [Bradyrhizobium lablabi]